MSMLFYADVKNNIILHPDVIKLCPELSLLTDKEILFIILCYDYNSIYRQFPERQRLSKAIWHVWQDNKPELLDEDKRPQKIKKAIEAYKSLQYNRNIELVEMYNRKIDDLLKILEEDNSTNGIKNAMDSIDRFRKAIRAIEAEIIEEKLIDGELKGNVKRSFLEVLQSNIKMYYAVTAKRG
ncbi:hypothetical protein [uncultured Clostridium sp.]|uniref:hypothetical protein n=1 Tax=uncultured Clostridium sp. TaxID=59620 RepID=UPI0026039079|nr:hypothetical protein [uncultured Clostridium sp.]